MSTKSTKYCSNCGAEIYEKTKICPNCGFRQLEDTPNENSEVSALLSAILPGLGQIYNGELFKGLVLIILFAFSLALVFVRIGIATTPLISICAIIDAYNPSALKIVYKTLKDENML